MKQLLLKSLLLILFFVSSSSFIYSQNNVKLLDLTSNTYAGSQSFYVNIGSQMQVTGNYTFEAWVYVDSYSSGNYPVIMDRRTVFSLYLIATSTTGDYRIRFVARDNSDNIITSMRNDGTSGSTDYNMDLQQWYHIAVSRDGTTARLFVDGNLLDTSTDPDFVLSTPSGNPVNYGARYWGGYERFFDGALDEMRYSDIARYTTAFTITTNTKPHPTSGDAHTVLLFNFDNSNVTNSTSANSYVASKHNSPFTYTNWDGFPADKLPLPVSYIRLLAASADKSSISLSWATASEIINQGFAIMRSPDGQNWSQIGFIEGAGNSNTLKEYSFIDNNPLKSNYYQLNQIDYDGKSHLSKIVYCALDKEQTFEVYPNPTHDILYLAESDNINYRHFEIYNSLGLCVKKIESQLNQIDVSELSKGIYLLIKYNDGGQLESVRFIKN